jgi:predicted dehydrogenase
MQQFESTQDVKVGVVGYGGAFNMGRQHLNQMRDAGMVPCAATDLDEDRLAVAREDFPGIETYTTLDEMLEKSAVNLVTIITPHNTHADLTLQCLNAGRHVVVEKPMAITTDECDRMIAAAEAGGLLLSTYHNRHWDGWILRAVDQIVKQGVVGDVIRIEAHMGGYGKPRDWWRTSRTISGGILYDWGVHLLEYSLQLLSGSLVEVSGFNHSGFWAPQTKWGDDSNEDEAFLVARFDNGQWLTLCITSIDSCAKGAERKWVEVTGTKGTYLFAGDGWKTVIQGADGAVTEEGENPSSEGHKFYENVAGALTGREDLIITAEWARRPIHILDLGVRSAEAGRALEAQYG